MDKRNILQKMENLQNYKIIKINKNKSKMYQAIMIVDNKHKLTF
jgi:hypothetical protein